MSLAPFFAAPPIIQIHILCALAAVALTCAIFLLPRGSSLHKQMGWVWVILMAIIALTSFWISEIELVGRFSPIHLLSIFTLFALVINIRAARRGNIRAHRKGMKSLTFGALLVAGAFTFLPGRLMFTLIAG